MKHLYLLIIIMCAGCKVCTNNSVGSMQVDKTIYPLETCVKTDNLADYIELIDIIPIDTAVKIGFNGVATKILIGNNGEIFILNQGIIVKLNSNGEKICDIGTKGRAHNEYLAPRDIVLSKDRSIITIFDATNELIKYETINGQFVERITVNEKENYEAICPAVNNGYNLLLSNPANYEYFVVPYYMVAVVDSTGRIYDNILPRKDFVFSIAMVTQCYNNDYFIRPQEGDKILFRVVEGNIEPYLGIDFGDKHVAPGYIFKQKGEMAEKMKSFICSDFYKVPIYIHDTRENLYFSCIGPKGTAHYFIVSNESAKGLEWKDSDDDRSPMMALASDEDYFYFLYDDYRSKEESAKSSPIKKAIVEKTGLELSENDNCVLVKIKFKI